MVTLAFHLGSLRITAQTPLGKVGSCLTMFSSLQYRTLPAHKTTPFDDLYSVESDDKTQINKIDTYIKLEDRSQKK